MLAGLCESLLLDDVHAYMNIKNNIILHHINVPMAFSAAVAIAHEEQNVAERQSEHDLGEVAEEEGGEREGEGVGEEGCVGARLKHGC